MCGNNNNNFFELSAVQSNMLFSDIILIGGQRRAIKKILAYKPQWLMDNWRNPMLRYTERLARIATGQPSMPRRPAVEYNIFPSATGQLSTPRRPAVDASPRQTDDRSSSDSGCCCTIL